MQSLTQAQVVASMQHGGGNNRGLLGGVSRVAATVFDQADAWAYSRMQTARRRTRWPASRLHQKLLEHNLLANGMALDPERMDERAGTGHEKDGRKEDVVAILKGIRPETLDFDALATCPWHPPRRPSATRTWPPHRNANPYARGLIEAMLEMPDGGHALRQPEPLNPTPSPHATDIPAMTPAHTLPPAHGSKRHDAPGPARWP